VISCLIKAKQMEVCRR